MNNTEPHESQSKPKTGPYDLNIDILGKRFVITAGGDPEYLEDVLAQYRTAVATTQNISQIMEPLKVAIVTGFMLCDEINKMKQQIKEEKLNNEKELDRITRNMIACIDQVMEKAEYLDD